MKSFFAYSLPSKIRFIIFHSMRCLSSLSFSIKAEQSQTKLLLREFRQIKTKKKKNKTKIYEEVKYKFEFIYFN